MPLFALTLSPPVRAELLGLVKALCVFFVVVSFISVAIYAARQLQARQLVDNGHAPVPLAPPPTAGWLFISSVLLLILVEPMLYIMLVLMVTPGLLAENRRTVAEQFGLRRLTPLRTVTYSLVAFGAVMLVEAPLSQGSTWVLDNLHISHPDQQTVETFRQYDTASAILWFLFQAVLLYPIIEELFFRGLLMTFFKNYMSTWTAIVLSSAIFATVHLNLGAFLPLWFLGFALGLVYEHTGSLLVPIFMHMCFNLATGLSLLLEKGSS